MSQEKGPIMGWQGLWWLGVSAVVLILDQITKIAVTKSLELYDVVPVVKFFNIVLVHNYGAAFGFLSSAGGWQRWFFTMIALGVSILLPYMLYHLEKRHTRQAVAYALILGGALGNVYDRITYGYVVDFIDWYVGEWHWPAFNIADSAICIAVAILIWDMIVEIKQARSTETHHGK